MSFVGALRPFAARERAQADAAARCELCGASIAERHRHVVETSAAERRGRGLLCACPACATLFSDPGASGARFRAVPTRVLFDPRSPLSDARWASLGVPVGLAFVARDSTRERWSALYPSPAGPVEAPVEDEAFQALAAAVPLARHVRADVEALVVRRDRAGRFECFVAPIDECFSLVGAVRARWRGFDGGDEARAAIDAFFDGWSARAEAIDRDGADRDGGEP